MKHYFYGLAADPFTLTHERIIRELLKDKQAKVFIGLTDHDYKNFTFPYELRKMIIESNLEDIKDRVEIVRQNARTYRFLCGLHDKIDAIVVGEDEWKDLNDGKWMFSNELLTGWEWKVIPRTDGVSSTEVRRLIATAAEFSELKNLISEKTFNFLKNF